MGYSTRFVPAAAVADVHFTRWLVDAAANGPDSRQAGASACGRWLPMSAEGRGAYMVNALPREPWAVACPLNTPTESAFARSSSPHRSKRREWVRAA